jgi:tetratricopeptide (TPR) repeat protein
VIAALERTTASEPRAETVPVYVAELTLLAAELTRTGAFDEAIAVARKCRATVGEPNSKTPDTLRKCVAATYHDVGHELWSTGRADAALEYLEVSDGYLAVLYAETPEKYRAYLAAVRNDWACALRDTEADRREEALAKADSALALLGPAAVDEPEMIAFARSAALDTKANVLRDLGRLDEMLPLYRRSAEILRELLTRSPGIAKYTESLTEVEAHLASAS